MVGWRAGGWRFNETGKEMGLARKTTLNNCRIFSGV